VDVRNVVDWIQKALLHCALLYISDSVTAKWIYVMM